MAYPGPLPLRRSARWAQAVWEAGLDIVYPRICWICEVPLSDTAPRHGVEAWFCQSCAKELPAVDAPYCAVCGEPFDGAMTEAFRCWNCEGRRIAFDFAVAGFKAEGAVRELIHRFKYQRQIALRGALGTLLQRTLEDGRLQTEDLSNWLLVPVPLHRAREQDREFNQSWELCRVLAHATGIPTRQILRRTRITETQAGLDRQERLANLRGVFALRRSSLKATGARLKGCCILLVDDVLTTGATTHECARVLKQDAGAEKVVVITVARG